MITYWFFPFDGSQVVENPIYHFSQMLIKSKVDREWEVFLPVKICLLAIYQCYARIVQEIWKRILWRADVLLRFWSLRRKSKCSRTTLPDNENVRNGWNSLTLLARAFYLASTKHNAVLEKVGSYLLRQMLENSNKPFDIDCIVNTQVINYAASFKDEKKRTIYPSYYK